VMTTEPPRFSGVLRAFLTERGKTFDYSSEYLNTRQDALKARKRRAVREEHRKDSMSWEFFSRWTTPENEKKMHEIYVAFQKAIKTMIGTEVQSEDELGCSMYLVYHALINEEKTESQKKIAVKKYFKAMTDNQFTKAASCAEKLNNFLVEQGNTTSQGGQKQTLEFGKDLSFDFSPVSAQPEYVAPPPVVVPKHRTTEIFEKLHVDASWLGECCAHYAQEVPTLPFDGNELTLSIREQFGGSKNDQTIQNDLLEMLGSESFDFVTMLLQRRAPIVKARISELDFKSKQTPNTPQSGFVVQSQQEQQHEKKVQQELRKLRTQLQKMTTQADWITEMGIDLTDKEAMRNAREERLAAGPDMTIQIGVDRPETQTYVLPATAIQKDYKTYEEVTLPAKIFPAPEVDTRVKIEEFEEFAQVAFRGYTHLNRIQSEVFPVAYKSNTNMLICAPTGAGKTNIAMMTVLREVGHHYREGRLHKV